MTSAVERRMLLYDAAGVAARQRNAQLASQQGEAMTDVAAIKVASSDYAHASPSAKRSSYTRVAMLSFAAPPADRVCTHPRRGRTDLRRFLQRSTTHAAAKPEAQQLAAAYRLAAAQGHRRRMAGVPSSCPASSPSGLATSTRCTATSARQPCSSAWKAAACHRDPGRVPSANALRTGSRSPSRRSRSSRSSSARRF